MSRWFSNHRRIISFISYILLLVLVFLISFFSEFNVVWWIVIGIGFSFIMLNFLNFFTLLEFKRAGKYLDDECDPDKYSQIINDIYDHNKIKVFRVTLLTHKAMALCSIGKYEENLELLKSIDIDQYPIQIEIKILYYNNLADAYIRVGEIGKGAVILSKANEMIDRARFNEKRKNLLKNCLESNSIDVLINENKLDEAEKLILGKMKIFLNNRHLVELKNSLATLYLKQGRIDDAKDCLDFVVNKGNKLFIAQKAKKLLETL